MIPIRSAKVRARPKGRSVDPTALEEIGALLADSPRRRDLLIEYLHKIQDRHGHLSAAQVDRGTTERSSILRFLCVWPMAMVWRCRAWRRKLWGDGAVWDAILGKVARLTI